MISSAFRIPGPNGAPSAAGAFTLGAATNAARSFWNNENHALIIKNSLHF
jgi:hypothetical protein